MYTRERGRSDGRLALLIFLGTLFGSLLGVAADFNEAKELVGELVSVADPMPTLAIAGSNTILGERLGLANAWREEFAPQVSVSQRLPVVGNITRAPQVVISPVGSHRGLELATQGKVHLLAMSDPMTADEEASLRSAGIEIRCAAPIGYDVIVFVTDLANDLEVTNRFALKSVLRGMLTQWSQVSDAWMAGAEPIRLLVRPGSGTTTNVLNSFLGQTAYLPHFIACDSNDSCLNAALSTPGSLVWVSASWLYTQPRRFVNTLLVSRSYTAPPTDPFSDDFVVNNYPEELIRPLYMYVLRGGGIAPEESDLAKAFFDYVRGVAGQETLEAHRFYTYFKSPADVTVTLPADFRTVSGAPLGLVCRS